MKATECSVHDIWANDEKLTETVIGRIEECGHYSRFNQEWQALSTMIDYALKKLKKNEGCQKRIIEALKGIDYVPLYLVASRPSIRLRALKTSPDGKIGINICSMVSPPSSTTEVTFDNSIDVFLTGSCQPVFTIVLESLKDDSAVSISPDSSKVAVLTDNEIYVWSIADCRIVRRFKFGSRKTMKEILWSGDSSRVIRVYDEGFQAFNLGDGSDFSLPVKIEEDVHNIIVNDDATEIYYMKENYIHFVDSKGPFHVFDTEDMGFSNCYLVRAKNGSWALTDNGIYLLSGENYERTGELDGSVDVDDSRFGMILGDHMSQKHKETDSLVANCSIKIEGSTVIFDTFLGIRGTHTVLMSSKKLSCEKSISHGQWCTRLVKDGIIHHLSDDYRYVVRTTGNESQARFFLVRGKEEIPLGTCRYDAVAAVLDGRIFIHKGSTIEVYDEESLDLLLSINPLDIDRWIVCGSDRDGTVSLVKVEDVESEIGSGSHASIRFARMKAPKFKLDIFEGCSLELDKVWNLRFGLSVRNDTVFCYNRDGNRVKPVTLNRYVLRSCEMKRSFTMSSDESKFSARICELSNHRIAVASMDDLDDNTSKDPRVTIRILDCDSGEGMELCDLTKPARGHLAASYISEVFSVKYDDADHVVVQFGSEDGSLICSRDANSRRHYPAEGDRFIHGKVVGHDSHTIAIRGEDGKCSLYDARLNLLKENVDPIEPGIRPSRDDSITIPSNRVTRLSFGEIIQNGGVFFCLKEAERGCISNLNLRIV
ncbi:MAG: hypothetical protein E7Z69_07935 [Thermoplasmata archaeon]|jgi:hypothetical protein|nr:hypothetical protein [Thermoplasmata archaeon]